MNTGDLINHTYRILKPIGSGGLGVIYLGYHENLQKYVVIKKVKDHCKSLVNCRIEVDILKSLHHRYLPQVYDFVQIGEEIFTIMDYISGHDLKSYLDAGWNFDEECLVLWMKQLCEVLDYLHTRSPKIIHCDIKPTNIMITEEGNVCLSDFNISLDGENNKELVGLSSQYASPEQLRKAECKMRYGSSDTVKMDERSDLYSLGAVFYKLITGITPNARRENYIPISQVEHPYDDGLGNIVDKAMEENPVRRFKSAGKMLEAIEHMEQWSSRYKHLIKTGRILDVGFGVLTLLLVSLMITGYQGMKRDAFFFAYDNYMGEVRGGDWLEEGTAEVLLQEGIHLLNQSDYSKKFQDYPSEKANVLYVIGQAELYQENYLQAEKYLLEAARCNQESADIYRDLAVAQAYCGFGTNARDTMEKAVECGLSKEDAKYIEAALAYQNGENQTAYDLGTEASKSEDTEIAKRAALIAVRASEQLGNTDECVGFVTALSEKAEGNLKVFWLRKAGELYMKLHRQNQDDSKAVENAIYCYQSIQNSGLAQLTDLYNLAFLYDEEDRFSECKQLLLSMRKQYPEEYEIAIRLSYINYRMENDKAVRLRDYTLVKQYYEEAEKICRSKEISISEDVNMVQMKYIIEELQKQGWLAQ